MARHLPLTVGQYVSGRSSTPFRHVSPLLSLPALTSPSQYGYHISVLNQIHAVLTCQIDTPNAATIELPTCIPMSQFAFSFLTAVFTIGGLVGSIAASSVMDSSGRRGTHRLCAILVAVGTAFMGLGTSFFPLLFGR